MEKNVKQNTKVFAASFDSKGIIAILWSLVETSFSTKDIFLHACAIVPIQYPLWSSTIYRCFIYPAEVSLSKVVLPNNLPQITNQPNLKLNPCLKLKPNWNRKKRKEGFLPLYKKTRISSFLIQSRNLNVKCYPVVRYLQCLYTIEKPPYLVSVLARPEQGDCQLWNKWIYYYWYFTSHC